ncbi:glycosyltransferase [Gammaproteobacteria bacterium]|nr:glycosyltransferase [Gammaproteobacteria bacterium]
MHKDLTIVMPSFGECESLQKLLPEILDCSSNALSRIIVVDDNSTDGTSEFIKENSFNCDIICINRLDRTGLSSAVIEGVMAADTKYIAVIDSDGQHDPSDLFAMHELIKKRDLDIIIGSRFVTNEQLDNHVGFRHTISKFGNRAANFLLKKELSDPMTGFFLFKRKIFVAQAHLIKPMGFKILLDFLFNIRNEAIKLEEFQINFRSRSAGESKIAMDVIFSFVDQILNKATNGIYPEKLSAYLFVGTLGILFNYSALILTHIIFSLPYQISQITAVLFSMLTNFHLNNSITFKRKKKVGRAYASGLILFLMINSIGFLANINIAFYLYNNDNSWWLSSFVGVIAFTLISFLFSRFAIWK